MIIMRKHSNLTDENGLTLVEILAAIVIISLIFVSIVTILNLTAKTNKSSEDIIDATYVAQEEMEYIYKISRENGSFESLEAYGSPTEEDGWDIYWKDNVESKYQVEVREKKLEDSMVRIVVRVYEQTADSSEKPKAQMETLLNWGEAHAEQTP